MKMIFLNEICSICLNRKTELRKINEGENGTLSYYEKMIKCIPEMHIVDIRHERNICDSCCYDIDEVYKFREKCLRNNEILREYCLKIDSKNQVENGHENVRVKEEKIDDNVPVENIIEDDAPSFDINGFVKTELSENVDTTDELSQNSTSSNSEEPMTSTETHPCNLCFTEFYSMYDLKKHRLTQHPGINLYDCQLCQKPLTSARSLQKHMKKVHDNKPHTCAVCQGNFESYYDLVRHQKVHENGEARVDIRKGVHVCEGCKEVFGTFAELSGHVCGRNEVETSRRRFWNQFCDSCNQGFNSLSALARHTCVRKENGQIKCNDCGQLFGNDQLLEKHQCIYDQSGPYKCGMCGNGYGTASSLARHDCMKMNTASMPSNVCKLCKEIFLNVTDLTEHKCERNEGEAKTGTSVEGTCKKCKQTFSNLNDLNKHSCVQKPNEFTCGFCEQSFQSLFFLSIHDCPKARDDQFRRVHECDVCHRTFSKLYELSRHKRRHNGRKQHTCNFCQTTFNTLSDLARHNCTYSASDSPETKNHLCTTCNRHFNSYEISSHRCSKDPEPNNFVCGVCTETFTDLALFKKHNCLNPDKKTYPCHICNRNFLHNCDLIRHMKIHSGKSRHQCETCGESFNTFSALARHDCGTRDFVDFTELEKVLRSYRCDACAKSFPDSETLEKHVCLLLERPQRRFMDKNTCDVCNRTFNDASEFVKHVCVLVK